MRQKRSLFLLFPLLLLLCCTSALLQKEQVKELNQSYSGKTFRVKTNLFATFSDPKASSRRLLFRKGEKVRIWIESDGDWIKVRAIRAKKSLENNPGVTILYILREILEDEGAEESVIEAYPPERLRRDIEALLQPL